VEVPSTPTISSWGGLVWPAGWAPARRARATTYWSAFDELLPLGRDIVPCPDDRFVDNGDVITAAGVSAGIDMAVHLVGRLGSPEKAREVRRYIQYDPKPPY
jgi:transcriptional regulator GlxA family with amidase domain